MNWGKRLLVLLVIFCVVLIYSVRKINSSVRTDLVSENYEQEATNYQQIIIAKKNAQKIKSFRVADADPFVVIEIPKEQIKKKVNGELIFYCAYNSDLDKKLQLVTDAVGQQLIPRSWIKAKTYTIKLSWTDGITTFYDEKNLSLK